MVPFHLSLEGHDYFEEIGLKQHAGYAPESVEEADAAVVCHPEADEAEEDAEWSQDNQGPHEADVPLKYNKYKVMLLGVPSSKDSAVMKLGLDVQTNLTVLAPWIRQAETTVPISDTTSITTPAMNKSENIRIVMGTIPPMKRNTQPTRLKEPMSRVAVLKEMNPHQPQFSWTGMVKKSEIEITLIHDSHITDTAQAIQWQNRCKL